MRTYQLYPGLKQILEDKRIKRFGVWVSPCVVNGAPEIQRKSYLVA